MFVDFVVFLCILLSLGISLSTVVAVIPDYCVPPDPESGGENCLCWPTSDEVSMLNESLGGMLLDAHTNNNLYLSKIDKPANLVWIRYPAWIVVANSAVDVQKGVTFARAHNMQISIWSTGHSYSGRNTANDSLMIHLGDMKHSAFNADNTQYTVETGLNWAEIYKNVSGVNKVIVGGADPTVGPGGYSMGGGHSPICPEYGLSSDSITDFYLVDAQSDIIHAYDTFGIHPRIDDLFWSLRGGGGSTFGVTINITFNLHDWPPASAELFTPASYNSYSENNEQQEVADEETEELEMVCGESGHESPDDTCIEPTTTTTNARTIATLNHFHCEWAADTPENNHTDEDIITSLFEMLQSGQISDKWGGVFTFTAETLNASFVYIGDYQQAYQEIEPFMQLLQNLQINTTCNCSLHRHRNFWDYEMFVEPFEPVRQFEANVFVAMNGLTHALATDLINCVKFRDVDSDETIDASVYQSMGWTIFVHGKVQTYPYGHTAVSPGFRSSVVQVSCVLLWENESEDNDGYKYGAMYEKRIRKYGESIYSNEENYLCPDCDWKEQFWGMQNYQRLLKTKRFWDPTQVFWCNHCVGDD